MEVVTNFKTGVLVILTMLMFNCSKDSETTNGAPKNFVVNVSEIMGTSAILNWTESLDPEGSTVFYDVYLKDKKLIDNVTELNFKLDNLQEGVVYSGTIVASDPEGNTTTVSYSFETSINQPPTPFSVSIITKDPLFSRIDWTASTDPEGGRIVYNVYLEENLLEKNKNSLYHFISDLKGITLYRGYVEAVDPEGKTYRANFAFLTDLKVFDNDIKLENQSQVDAFGASGYNKINGYLFIGSSYSNLTNISNLESLNTIQSVNGDIYIQNTICKTFKGLEKVSIAYYFAKLTIDNNDELLSLQGLEGITTLHEIYIAGNKNLLSFEGLHNLKTVTNYLNFPYNESLKSIEGLRGLTTINDLDIGNNDALTNLKGLEKVKNINTLAISGNDNLQSLDGLNNMITCNSIAIENNATLPNLLGLTNLNTVSGLYVSGNAKLINLVGLEKLIKVTRAITVQLNESLETLQGINNVVFNGGTSYGYSLGIHNNGKLTNLDVLVDYTFSDQKGSFNVSSNPELVDFCGLSKLTKELDITQINENLLFRWNKFNPTYDDMITGKCSQ